MLVEKFQMLFSQVFFANCIGGSYAVVHFLALMLCDTYDQTIFKFTVITVNYCLQLGYHYYFCVNIDERFCPEGWRQKDDYCYLFSADEKTWSSARRHCTNLQADLTSVLTWAEQDFIYCMLTSLPVKNYLHLPLSESFT